MAGIDSSYIRVLVASSENISKWGIIGLPWEAGIYEDSISDQGGPYEGF